MVYVNKSSAPIVKGSDQDIVKICESFLWDQNISEIKEKPSVYGTYLSSKASRNKGDIDNLMEFSGEQKFTNISIYMLGAQPVAFSKTVPEDPKPGETEKVHRILNINSHPLVSGANILIENELQELGENPVLKVSIGYPEQRLWWNNQGFEQDPEGSDENDLVLRAKNRPEYWTKNSDEKWQKLGSKTKYLTKTE